MFSDRRNSERENKSERGGLELAVRGSSVPMHSQQPKTCKEHKVVKHAVKQAKRKEFPFPVDKIIYLAERLEVTSMTERKIKSVSLSAVDVKGRSSLSDVGEELLSCRDCEQKREERSRSPDFDFALDLSSVCSTGAASDEYSDDLGKPYLQCNDPGVPHGEKTEEKTTRPRDCSCLLPEDNSFSARGERNRSFRDIDSINYYMNAIDNDRDLLRYFRPCRTCNELYCVCSESPASKCARCCPDSERGHARSLYKANKAIETDDNLTGFARECSSRSTPRPTFCQSECCYPEVPDCVRGECPCEFQDRCGRSECFDASAGSDRVLTYTSSLANAARSARVLARDLELILSTLNNVPE